ncbi:MAG TPA: DUF488 family protein [Burkholderiales bacterium]|jgi:uncharacterized protein YeaO (DUF488 family)
MAIRVVRLGTPRANGEGLRLGTVRRPPRGVKKADFARLDYYDLWLPLLSPSQPVVTRAMSQPWTEARWTKFVRDYRREMGQAEPAQIIALLAQMSQHADFSVGCYCEREDRCHRSVLKALLEEQGARFA